MAPRGSPYRLYNFLVQPDLDGSQAPVDGVKQKYWAADDVLKPIVTLKKRLCKSLRERFPGLKIHNLCRGGGNRRGRPSNHT